MQGRGVAVEPRFDARRSARGRIRAEILRRERDPRRDRFIVGTPDECRAEIRRYRDLLGVNYFLLRPQWPGVPQKRVLEQIELIGRELIPGLRAA